MPSTEIIKPQSDLMLSSANEIDTLCADLKKLGITFFSHTRIFNDGSRIDIHNNAKMIEEFYYGADRMYEHYTPEIDPQSTQENILLLDSLEDNASFQFLREGYDIDHMLAKIDKHDSYCDVWNFGTNKNNKDIKQVYFNHLDILILFTFLYLDKCNDLIKQCEQDPILIRRNIVDTNTAVRANKHYTDIRKRLVSKIERYYLNGGASCEYLTQTEFECCQWIYCGKTSEEIAMIFSRSKRTIEKHIENIKNKLGCYNKSQLVQAIKTLRVF